MEFGYCPDPMGQWWPETLAMLHPAIERGNNDQIELETKLSAGRAQLWIATDPEPVAALVSQKDGETLEIWLVGGAVLDGCVPFLAIIERAAIEGGMTNGRISGRQGWARVLKPWGWRVVGNDIVKELS
jgi:hypothetical protein